MKTNTHTSNMDRRKFIRAGAAVFAGTAFMPVAASCSRAKSENGNIDDSLHRSPGFYRFSMGDVEITVLNDGAFRLPSEIFAFNADPERREEYFHSRRIPSDWHPYQASPALIDNGNQRILIDSGSGEFPYEMFSDNDGLLAYGLQAAGISPESIDAVILTHAHPDHLGGIVNPNSQEPFFPNAEISCHFQDSSGSPYSTPGCTTGENEPESIFHRPSSCTNTLI
ncbi:MAG: MBL fold metallo-hydrolase [Balneolaceae bacterium]|nr:MAG: MBL fold metallo-hydrolase [Balneolaceae bacterium]